MDQEEIEFDGKLERELKQIEVNLKDGRYKNFNFDSNVKYGLFLRHILLKGYSEDKKLYVSVGEADWLYAFLSRLFNETIEQKVKPKIEKLVVLHLSKKGVEDYKKVKQLPDYFLGRMHCNLKGLNDLTKKCASKRVDQYPEYHGYMYGKWALTGKWVTVNNKSNVRTGLTAYYNNNNFRLFRKMFIEQGIYDGE
jgi:hypothetical protein